MHRNHSHSLCCKILQVTAQPGSSSRYLRNSETAYPAFSRSIGTARLRFLTISAVMFSSVIFLFPGT